MEILYNKKRNFFVLPVKEAKGHVLFSYINSPFFRSPGDPLSGHSNMWESREIAKIFNLLGYNVTCINYYDDIKYFLRYAYTAVFDINDNLAFFRGQQTILLHHITGSYPRFTAIQEIKRSKEFRQKTNRLYKPKRLVANIRRFDRSMSVADHISLLGNETTLKTFPTEIYSKTTLIPATASYLYKKRRVALEFPEQREFLYFSGYGAVLKGLDLVLDIFSIHPEWTLHICCSLDNEYDFISAYKDILEKDNIKYHGTIDPASSAFPELLENVFCFISPSCSEGMSTSVLTCLQFGLFPIISKNCGVTLPNDAGLVLKEITHEEIFKSIRTAFTMDRKKIVEQTTTCQKYCEIINSRENFTKNMTRYIKTSMNPTKSLC